VLPNGRKYDLSGQDLERRVGPTPALCAAGPSRDSREGAEI
jgi:hypothetical protein